MGIGGGFIMNIYIEEEQKAYTLDAREIAAGHAYEEMHLSDPRTTNEGTILTTKLNYYGCWFPDYPEVFFFK
jgi:gamma-glutamyltranspeptidase